MSINQLNALFRDFMQFYVYFLIFALSKINYARTLIVLLGDGIKG
jgi:hypothetical protein